MTELKGYRPNEEVYWKKKTILDNGLLKIINKNVQGFQVPSPFLNNLWAKTHGTGFAKEAEFYQQFGCSNNGGQTVECQDMTAKYLNSYVWNCNTFYAFNKLNQLGGNFGPLYPVVWEVPR